MDDLKPEDDLHFVLFIAASKGYNVLAQYLIEQKKCNDNFIFNNKALFDVAQGTFKAFLMHRGAKTYEEIFELVSKSINYTVTSKICKAVGINPADGAFAEDIIRKKHVERLLNACGLEIFFSTAVSTNLPKVVEALLAIGVPLESQHEGSGFVRSFLDDALSRDRFLLAWQLYWIVKHLKIKENNFTIHCARNKRSEIFAYLLAPEDFLGIIEKKIPADSEEALKWYARKFLDAFCAQSASYQLQQLKELSKYEDSLLKWESRLDAGKVKRIRREIDLYRQQILTEMQEKFKYKTESTGDKTTYFDDVNELFFLAIVLGRIEIVKAFVEIIGRGVNDALGTSHPLAMAIDHNQPEIAAYLKSKGAIKRAKKVDAWDLLY